MHFGKRDTVGAPTFLIGTQHTIAQALSRLTIKTQMIGNETIVSDNNISVVIINRRTVKWISYHLAPMLPSRIDAVVIIIISTRYMVCDTRVRS